MIYNFLAMIIVTLLLVAGTMVFLNYYTLHDEEVEVPNVSGLSENVAVRKLEALDLRTEVADTGYVYRAAAGSILEQSMPPGSKVKAGRLISLTINADGPRKIALPDIADNCSRRQAEDKLRTLGFKLAATEYVEGDPEWVIAVKVNGKSVQAGTRISLNFPITLVVGEGVEDEYNGNDSLDYMLNTSTEEMQAAERAAQAAEIENAANSNFE